MKQHLIAVLLAVGAAQASAADAIYIGGVKYSYQASDFTAITATTKVNGADVQYVAGYKISIPVYVDEPDDYYDYATLIFDLKAEVSALAVTEPLKLSYDVSCSGIPIGSDMDLIFSKRGKVTPARLTVYEMNKTNGQCTSLDVLIRKQGSVSQNINTDISAIKFDALIAIQMD